MSYFKIIFIAIFILQSSILNSYSVENLDKKTVEIIRRVLETDKKNKSYQAQIYIYSKGFYEKGVKKNTENEVKMAGLLTFKRPAKVLFKVEDSTDSMAKGSTLLYTGGEKIQIRASGILGLIKLSFDIDNPMFSNARNHKFSFDGLKNLRSGILKSDLLGKVIKNGNECHILKIIPLNKADSEITHEIYFIDVETYRVVAIEMYVNNQLVSQYSVKNMKSNIVKNDDFFRL